MAQVAAVAVAKKIAEAIKAQQRLGINITFQKTP
jgi:hypothetical protein